MLIRKTAVAGGTEESRPVMLCDSDARFAEPLVERLEARGLRVLWLRDADEAIEVLDLIDVMELPFADRVVVDSCLEKDAYRIIEWIRTRDCALDASVTLMVMRGEEIESWNQRAYRPDEYVIKPWDSADLPL